MKNPGSKIVIGVIIGGLVGLVYYWIIGCRTGNCNISGNPVNSILYGSFVGLIWNIPLRKRDQEWWILTSRNPCMNLLRWLIAYDWYTFNDCIFYNLDIGNKSPIVKIPDSHMKYQLYASGWSRIKDENRKSRLIQYAHVWLSLPVVQSWIRRVDILISRIWWGHSLSGV